MKRYAARVEWLAIKEEALDMLTKGYGYQLLYDHLQEQGKVTMAFKTCYRYIKNTPDKKAPKTPPPPSAPRRLGVGSNEPIINHTSTPRRDDLV